MNFRYDVPKYEKAELKYAKAIFFLRRRMMFDFSALCYQVPFILQSSGYHLRMIETNSLSEAKLKKKN